MLIYLNEEKELLRIRLMEIQQALDHFKRNDNSKYLKIEYEQSKKGGEKISAFLIVNFTILTN